MDSTNGQLQKGMPRKDRASTMFQHYLTSFDLLIFDLDGVLVDTSPSHGFAYTDLWGLLGITGPPYEEIAGRNTGEVVKEYTAELKPDRDRIKEWVNFKQERARQYLASAEIAFDDSVECVMQLTGKGQRLALGTGASRRTTGMVLRRFGWELAFSSIVTGEDVVFGKPEPEIYLAAMERSGVPPDRTLIVEDSQSGLAAAAASCAYSASVRSGARIDDERFVGDFPDIRTMLNELDKID